MVLTSASGPRITTIPASLPRYLSKSVFFLNVGASAFAADDAVGARGPRFGVHEERNNIGRGHAGVDVLIGPSAAEGAPGFKVGVAQAHRGQLVAGPLTGALHVGGSGESFPDRVH